MTCGSERSGMASSLMLLIDHQAPTSAKATPRKTMKRFLAQNSMILVTTMPSLLMLVPRHRRHLRRLALRLDGRAQPRLGVEHEVAGGDDRVAGAQAVEDLDARLGARAQPHAARLVHVV